MDKVDLELMRHEVRTTTQHFSRLREKQVKVIFGGMPMTDSKGVVHIPELQADKMDPEMVRAVRGYVDHEAGGHIGFTDHRVKIDDPVRHAYMIGLEDPRVDRLHCEEFPGAKKNIEAALAVLTREHTLPAMQADPPNADNIPEYGAVLASLVGRKMWGLTCPEAEEAIELFPANITMVAEQYAERALKAKNTKEVLKIADEYMKALLVECRQMQQSSKPSDGQGDSVAMPGGDGNGKSGEQNKAGAAPSKAPPPEGPDSDGDATEPDQGAEPEGDGDKEGAAGGGGDGGQEDGPSMGGADGRGPAPEATGAKPGKGASATGSAAPPSKALDPSMRQIIDAIKDDSGLLKFEADPDIHEVVTEKGKPKDEEVEIIKDRWIGDMTDGRAKFAQELNKVPAAAGNMTKTFLRILAAKQRRDRHRGLEEGRLDSRRLTQAAMGNTNVFFKQSDRVELNTYVHVLVDASGSMGSSAALLKTSLAAMGKALEATGISWGCHTFTGLSGRNKETRAMMRAVEDAARAAHNAGRKTDIGDLGLCAMFELKAPNERLMNVSHRFAAVGQLICGGTPTSTALKMVFPLIERRTEDKKLIIVLTDGEPNDPDTTKELVKASIKRGVPVVGLLIGGHVSKKSFPIHERIGSLTELANTTLKAVWEDLK